jgi:hypothetical protein
MRRKAKKLVLSKQTLRDLTPVEARQVAGGSDGLPWTEGLCVTKGCETVPCSE